MTTAARFSQADVKRAVAGVLAAGVNVARVEIAVDGSIVVICGPAESPAARINPLDRLLVDRSR